MPQIQNVLIFDSRFENGNLKKAAKVNNVEYNLWLENDHNTKGHTQWYFFKVVYKDIPLAADKKVHKIKFNILNLAKTSSLYQVGMMPCVWSRRRFDKDGTGWFRGGLDIQYSQNNIPRSSDAEMANQVGYSYNQYLYQNNGAGEGTETYFTLSFKYEFEPNQNDEVWFAHAVPYDYTKMQKELKAIVEKEEYQSFLKMNLLCLTLAKNPVPMLTVTSEISSFLDYEQELLLKRLPNPVRKQYRAMYTHTRKLFKQCQLASLKVQKLLEAAAQENVQQFCEGNQEEILKVSGKLNDL